MKSIPLYCQSAAAPDGPYLRGETQLLFQKLAEEYLKKRK